MPRWVRCGIACDLSMAVDSESQSQQTPFFHHHRLVHPLCGKPAKSPWFAPASGAVLKTCCLYCTVIPSPRRVQIFRIHSFFIQLR